MNAASGSEIENASATAPIKMPKIAIVVAGGTLDVSDAKEGSIKVIGLYGNGANSVALTASTTAVYDEDEPTYSVSGDTLTVPAAGEDAPIQYLVKFDRDVESGMKLTNEADKFPNTVQLTLYVSYVDPCDDHLKPAYLYIPSFMADPSMTLSLDRETQTEDFGGTLQMSYCGTQKTLYVLYFPDEEIVSEGVSA